MPILRTSCEGRGVDAGSGCSSGALGPDPAPAPRLTAGLLEQVLPGELLTTRLSVAGVDGQQDVGGGPVALGLEPFQELASAAVEDLQLDTGLLGEG